MPARTPSRLGAAAQTPSLRSETAPCRRLACVRALVALALPFVTPSPPTGAVPPYEQVVVFVMDLDGSSGPGDAATLSIADAFQGVVPVCEATWPGHAGWEQVPSPVPAAAGRWLFTPIQLARSAVMLRCSAQQIDAAPRPTFD